MNVPPSLIEWNLQHLKDAVIIWNQECNVSQIVLETSKMMKLLCLAKLAFIGILKEMPMVYHMDVLVLITMTSGYMVCIEHLNMLHFFNELL